jgi:hypothetical protein
MVGSDHEWDWHKGFRPMTDTDIVERLRVISANDMHVLVAQYLDAAREIHIAMCLFDDDHVAQENLNSAMHSVLTGAEQCRQLHQSEKRRVANNLVERRDDD